MAKRIVIIVSKRLTLVRCSETSI